MNKRIIAGIALATTSALLIAAGAQPQRPDAGPNPTQDMGQKLIAGLLSTEGCLGVENPRFSDGRRSIMAWFENKAAAERWYYSDTHQFFLKSVGSGDHKPLEFVADENAPILVIATIDFAGQPATNGPIPFSAISVELYTPLPGGAYINKRLAPEGVNVPHMRNLTAQQEQD